MHFNYLKSLCAGLLLLPIIHSFAQSDELNAVFGDLIYNPNKEYNSGSAVVVSLEDGEIFTANQKVPAAADGSNNPKTGANKDIYWGDAASTTKQFESNNPNFLNDLPSDIDTETLSAQVAVLSDPTSNTTADILPQSGDILLENSITGERAAWKLHGEYRKFLTLDNVLSGGVAINQFTTAEKIVSSGDFDKDGEIDLVCDNSENGTKSIKFLNNSSVSSSLSLLTTSTSIRIVGTADFNNDGIIDLVTDDSSTGLKTIHYLSGSGKNLSVVDTLNIATDLSYRLAGVLDINSDGNPDFVTEERTSSTDPLFKVDRQIWYTNGTSITSRKTWLSFDQEWTIINVGDFDIDGTPDLMVEQFTTGRKGIWYMNTDSIREGFEYVTLEEKWKSGCSGDFNNDGSTDALFQDNTTGDVIILNLGNQDGSGNPGGAKYTVQLLNLNFVSAGNSSATTDWSMKGFVDHDLNGQSSILAQNTNTGDLSLWDFSSGSLISSTFKNISSNLRVIGAGQFSGDSTPDIILENTSNGQKVCWIMTHSSGSYSFSSEVLIKTDSSHRVVGIGDFNSDAQLDLVVEQISSSTSPVFKTYRYIWFMNGTDIVSTHQFLYFDQEWEIKGTMDFDGNGTPDMIVEQKNVGRRGVWYMVGQDLVEGFIYCTVDPSWQFAN